MASFADAAKLLEEVRALRVMAVRTVHNSILLRLQSECARKSLRAAIQDSRYSSSKSIQEAQSITREFRRRGMDYAVTR
jgi:hypothetical protein